MIIEDFISFGRTVPEKSKRYGEKVCMAGFSPEMRQLIRLYPIPPQFKIKARSMSMVNVERNKMDSRIESWAIKDRDPGRALKTIKTKIDEKELINILEKYKAESINALNDQRKSLGIIKPFTYKPLMKIRAQFKNDNQLTLFDDFRSNFDFKTAADYFRIPYLYFTDTSSHRLQIREWGLYELLRKYIASGRILEESDVEKSLYLKDDRVIYLVVGNMAHVRKSWLIIKIFSFKAKPKQKDLFDD